MQLKLNKNRELIDEDLSYAGKALDKNKDPSEYYKSLANRRGIELVSMPSCLKDTRWSCNDYVFSHLMQENWDNGGDVASLFGDVKNFLLGKGYSHVQEPIDLDVIIYGNGRRDPELRLMDYEVTKGALHFGVWLDGQVVSKWGEGPVFKHNIEWIPTNFGDLASFYRRRIPVKDLRGRLKLEPPLTKGLWEQKDSNGNKN